MHKSRAILAETNSSEQRASSAYGVKTQAVRNAEIFFEVTKQQQ